VLMRLQETSVMAREAVRRSTLRANGVRPLYTNKAARSPIGCATISVSIILELEPLEEEVEGERATSVRVPFAHGLF
ncbi:hypothetical protein XENOCAPTIV_017403, partial [Xenoophorus captivus]